jgi:hypothetical protein
MNEFDDLLGKLEWFDLDGFVPQEEAVALVPVRLARAFNLIPIWFAGRILALVVSELDADTIDMMNRWLGEKTDSIEYRRGDRTQIKAAIERCYSVQE